MSDETRRPTADCLRALEDALVDLANRERRRWSHDTPRQEMDLLPSYLRLDDALAALRGPIAWPPSWPTWIVAAVEAAARWFDDLTLRWGWEPVRGTEAERKAYIASREAWLRATFDPPYYQAAVDWQEAAGPLGCDRWVSELADEARVLGYAPSPASPEDAKRRFKDAWIARYAVPRIGLVYPKFTDTEQATLDGLMMHLRGAADKIAQLEPPPATEPASPEGSEPAPVESRSSEANDPRTGTEHAPSNEQPKPSAIVFAARLAESVEGARSALDSHLKLSALPGYPSVRSEVRFWHAWRVVRRIHDAGFEGGDECQELEEAFRWIGNLLRRTPEANGSIRLTIEPLPLDSRLVDGLDECSAMLRKAIAALRRAEGRDEGADPRTEATPVVALEDGGRTSEGIASGIEAPPNPKLRVPSEQAVQCYRLKYIRGDTLTQSEIAEQVYGHRELQSKVSRALKTVEAWIKAGNVLPDLEAPRPKTFTVDPRELDRGKRQSGYARRKH